MESISVAGVLMLLSRGGDGDGEETTGQVSKSRASPPPRVFECKTCSRRFPSFQALGGHRASHKRPRHAGEGSHAELAKPRVHECSICGLEFAIGQALGGHMRRHRAAAAESLEVKNKYAGEKRGLWLDLNLPPEEGNGEECRKKIFGFELVDHATPMVVDCFH
ncbi:hypothetical protein Cni_G25039 [Canna indica]|uniref:C2H2-type domain-containing protein n=1 Tax=Canna indica TaxID=4628 RepID=A0AAQ3KZE7_9LILI|nr:hypothetical protein Cni_G25039 [Canna indica]